MDTPNADAHQTTSDEFNNGQPYCLIAGEIVADMIALLTLVREQRPETAAFGNTPIVTVDLRERTITVGLIDSANQKVAIVEQIDVDPGTATTFGASTLGVVVPKGSQAH